MSVTFRDANALRRVLYGLQALLDLHIYKIEGIYLPLLEARLSAAEAASLLLKISAVAQPMSDLEPAEVCSAALALD